MNPVQSLQHMLNHLARTMPALPRLAETRTFDEPTLEAVMVFQRDSGIPVTGIVDQALWNAITAAYYDNLFHYWTPPLLHVFPGGSESTSESEQAPEVLIAQAMISELAKILSNFENVHFDGINSGATHRNISLIQALASLEETGTFDRATWAILAALYRIYVTRKAMNTFPL